MKSLIILLCVCFTGVTSAQEFKLKQLSALIKVSKEGESNIFINAGESIRLIQLYDEDTWIASYKSDTGFIKEVYIVNSDEYVKFKAGAKSVIPAKKTLTSSERKTIFIKQYGSVYGSAVADYKIKIGMTKEMVIMSWGKPNKVNRTVTANLVSEQWVYETAYLYFTNGKLTSWQD